MTDKKNPITGRLRLDDFTIGDLPVYREWFLASDPERQTCRPLSDLSLGYMTERFEKRSAEDNSKDFAVRRVEDNEFIGRVTYFDLNSRNGAVEIGFFIGPPHRGRGYAREAVSILLDHLLNELKLNKVMAQTGEFNEPSIKLLKSLGFSLDGRLRRHHTIGDTYYDDLLFSLLKDEFEDNE
jgi:ribosomal-protein-alanine N-acetyltransferase